VASLSRPVLLDEVQRAGPDLLLAIKGAVDADQTPGQFLLTGSANLLNLRHRAKQFLIDPTNAP
jgi:predicted AAA+ superfamily ATPase